VRNARGDPEGASSRNQGRGNRRGGKLGGQNSWWKGGKAKAAAGHQSNWIVPFISRGELKSNGKGFKKYPRGQNKNNVDGPSNGGCLYCHIAGVERAH